MASTAAHSASADATSSASPRDHKSAAAIPDTQTATSARCEPGGVHGGIEERDRRCKCNDRGLACIRSNHELELKESVRAILREQGGCEKVERMLCFDLLNRGPALPNELELAHMCHPSMRFVVSRSAKMSLGCNDS